MHAVVLLGPVALSLWGSETWGALFKPSLVRSAFRISCDVHEPALQDGRVSYRDREGHVAEPHDQGGAYW